MTSCHVGVVLGGIGSVASHDWQIRRLRRKEKRDTHMCDRGRRPYSPSPRTPPFAPAQALHDEKAVEMKLWQMTREWVATVADSELRGKGGVKVFG